MQLIQTLFAIFLLHLIHLQIMILQRIYLVMTDQVFEYYLELISKLLQKLTPRTFTFNSLN